MTTYLFKPDCPFSDASGFIEKSEYYNYVFTHGDDKNMTIGNKRIVLNYNSDSMEPTQHMIDGKMYTSKKAYRAATKAAGCIEVGNDTKYINKKREPVRLDKRQRRDEIKKVINDLKCGNVPRPVLLNK